MREQCQGAWENGGESGAFTGRAPRFSRFHPLDANGRELPPALEVKPNLRCQRTRCHVVGAAERRQEVVQSIFVGQVDRRHLQTPLVPVAFEEVVVADSQVKEVS